MVWVGIYPLNAVPAPVGVTVTGIEQVCDAPISTEFDGVVEIP
jgi:hypothetical protein